MPKLTAEEKQALKEFGKSKEFKSWQKEAIVWVLLLFLGLVFLWNYYPLLLLFIVVMASIVGIR